MSFTDKTPNYNLPQWTDSPEDKPSWLVDVNNAFEAIDAGMNTNKRSIETTNTNISSINTTISTMQSEIESLQSDSVESTGDIADLDARVKVNTAHIVDIDRKADSALGKFSEIGFNVMQLGENVVSKINGSAASRTYLDFSVLNQKIADLNLPGNIGYVWLYINFNLTGVPTGVQNQSDILWMNVTNTPFIFENFLTRVYGGSASGEFSNVTLEIIGPYNPDLSAGMESFLGMGYKKADLKVGTDYNGIQVGSLASQARVLYVNNSTINISRNYEPKIFINDFDRGNYTPPVIKNEINFNGTLRANVDENLDSTYDIPEIEDFVTEVSIFNIIIKFKPNQKLDLTELSLVDIEFSEKIPSEWRKVDPSNITSLVRDANSNTLSFSFNNMTKQKIIDYVIQWKFNMSVNGEYTLILREV